jgi:HK97 family phage major capsid protein
LQDSRGIERILRDLLGKRVGRAVNAHMTNGTGGGTQPTGITSITPTITGAAGTGTATGSITYTHLLDLVHAVDWEYLDVADDQEGHVGFMTSSTMLRNMRAVVDGAGASVVSTGPAVTILGWPVVINNDMPSPGPNARSLIFGNLHAAYVARLSRGSVMVQTLRERFGDALQEAWQCFGSFDGRPDDVSALRVYAHGAS